MSTLTTLAICIACHGANGISAAPNIPNLAGQKELYMYQELVKFKQGTRVSVMNGIVAGLTDEELRNLAGYFSKLRPKTK